VIITPTTLSAICCLHLQGKSISFMRRWGTDIVEGQKETGLWAVQTLIGGPLTGLFLFLLSLYLYPHFPAQFVLPWRWEAVGSLKRWYLSNSLCGITYQMTINFIYTAMTASNLMPTVCTRAHRYTLWISKWRSQSTLRHTTGCILWKIPYENNLWDTYVSYFPLSTPMSMQCLQLHSLKIYFWNNFWKFTFCHICGFAAWNSFYIYCFYWVYRKILLNLLYNLLLVSFT
jgi:hypothetical protein